ncbi:MAG: hypothetical protein LBF15_00535 [Candidatus Peribacteria bacterium]|jgi:hypothetical protein|nr:hypothetical protein [Candidatus Peribacteria bacterium]
MQESQERVEAVQQLQKPVEEQPQEPVGEMQKPQETQEINSSVKRIL